MADAEGYAGAGIKITLSSKEHPSSMQADTLRYAKLHREYFLCGRRSIKGSACD